MPGWLEITGVIFLVVYTIEFGLRFFAYNYYVLRSNWVRFDLFLIITGLGDIIFKQINVQSDRLKQFMLVRILRLARLAHAVRLMVQFKVLWQLVQGLMASLGTCLWTFLLVSILMYSFAILGVEMINFDTSLPLDDPYNVAVQEHFSNLGDAFFLMLQCFTFDSIGGIYRPLVKKQPFLFLYFIAVPLSNFHCTCLAVMHYPLEANICLICPPHYQQQCKSFFVAVLRGEGVRAFLLCYYTR